MSRWFRHYAGMMRDDKLVSVAIKSKQPVERVVWVWGAILESAAEIDDDGRFNLDAAEVAYFLRADEADIGGIVAALVAADRVAEGRVVKWGDRQFTSDRSADRQAKYRERKRSEKRDGDKDETSGDVGVTSLSRHGDAPETETEAYTSSLRSDEKARDRASFAEFWTAYPNKTGKPVAEKAYLKAIRSAPHEAIMAGLARYIEGKPADRAWLNPSTFLNQERWDDQPANVVPMARGSPQAFGIDAFIGAVIDQQERNHERPDAEIEGYPPPARLIR